MTAPLLELDDVVVEYPGKGRGRNPFRVLHGISLTIAPGETLGLVGESGSGKTTLGLALMMASEPMVGVYEHP
ncbi:ATP-binding cassette domain-containing protein, partial [Streptomyces sp. NPDC020125]|uniref:ATP-binding cassette domain-containing protein n=1 Tax=Streptomyces sp. NPDC020125 TaxID=3154593 RepID=UPI0033CDA2D2